MNAFVQVAALGLAAACLTGCGGESERAEIDPSPAEGEQLFDKGKGVRLPPDMRQHLGVETVEVTEHVVAWRTQKPAQVYRTAHGAKPAAAVAWFDAADTAFLRAGQSVPLLAPPPEVRELNGVLRRFETNSGGAFGQVEGVIEFGDRDERIPAGSFLNATFTALRTNTVLAVPASAVVDGVAGAFVYALNGEHFVRTIIKTGATDDGRVEVTDGLYAGDIVVSRAARSLWMIELCALKGGSPCCPAPLARGEK